MIREGESWKVCRKRDRVITCEIWKISMSPKDIKEKTRDEKKTDWKAGRDWCDVSGEEKMWLMENRLNGSERGEQGSINYWWNKCLTDWLNLALCCLQISQAVRLRAAFVQAQTGIPTGPLMSWSVGDQCKRGLTADLTSAKESLCFCRNEPLVQPILAENNFICNSKAAKSRVGFCESDFVRKTFLVAHTLDL